MPIQWNKDLELGIRVIDNQHMRIVDYINELDAARHTHSRDSIQHVLDELVDYTLSHFAFEESLMEEAAYPFVNAHKKVHQLFVRRVSDYQQKFKLGQDIAEELSHTLQTWLINHIRHDDNDYSADVSANLAASTERVKNKKASWWRKLF